MRYLLLLILLSGCYTQKKAEKQLTKAQLNYPLSVAKKTSEWYPCVEETRVDTVKVTEWRLKVDSVTKLLRVRDTVVMKTVYTCEDLPTLQSQLQAQKNIIIKLQQLIYEKPPVVVTTKLIKDSAGITLLRAQISDLTNKSDEYQVKYQRSMKWLIFVLIAFSVSILLHLLTRKK
jgi:hypothetical protein